MVSSYPSSPGTVPSLNQDGLKCIRPSWLAPWKTTGWKVVALGGSARTQHLNELHLKDGAGLDKPIDFKGYLDWIKPTSTQTRQPMYVITHDEYLFTIHLSPKMRILRHHLTHPRKYFHQGLNEAEFCFYSWLKVILYVECAHWTILFIQNVLAYNSNRLESL